MPKQLILYQSLKRSRFKTFIYNITEWISESGLLQPVFWYNVLLWFSCVLALSIALLSLVVETAVQEGSMLESFTIALSFTSVLCSMSTLIISTALCFAILQYNTSLMKACRSMLLGSTVADVSVLLFGIYLAGIRFDSLIRELVDWKQFIRYYQEPYIRDDMDSIQRGLKCCGFQSYMDWDLNPYFSCNSTGYSRCSVPFSCCKREPVDSSCVVGIRDSTNNVSDYIYTVGCLQSSKDWYKYTIIVLSSLVFYEAILKLILIKYIYSYTSQNDERYPQEQKMLTKGYLRRKQAAGNPLRV